MKTKFKDSDISIVGKLYIIDDKNANEIEVSLNGSKGKTKSGVYELVNKLNGKRYIGMARNLENRYFRHFRDLRAGEHCNKLLQHDFDNQFSTINFNRENIFEFRVIIYCRPSELTFYEHILISNLNPEYNIHKQKEISIIDSEEFLNTEGENDRLKEFTYPDPREINQDSDFHEMEL